MQIKAARRTEILGEALPTLEIYSIDEAFGDFTGIADPATLAGELHVRVRRWTGIPIIVGLGPTKVLAKKNPDGVHHVATAASLTELADIQAALAAYVARVGEKLRRQHLVCGALSVFLLTNPFRTDEPQYNPQISSEFAEPKNFTPDLQQEAQRLLGRIYRPGIGSARLASCCSISRQRRPFSAVSFVPTSASKKKPGCRPRSTISTASSDETPCAPPGKVTPRNTACGRKRSPAVLRPAGASW